MWASSFYRTATPTFSSNDATFDFMSSLYHIPFAPQPEHGSLPFPEPPAQEDTSACFDLLSGSDAHNASWALVENPNIQPREFGLHFPEAPQPLASGSNSLLRSTVQAFPSTPDAHTTGVQHSPVGYTDTVTYASTSPRYGEVFDHESNPPSLLKRPHSPVAIAAPDFTPPHSEVSESQVHGSFISWQIPMPPTVVNTSPLKKMHFMLFPILPWLEPLDEAWTPAVVIPTASDTSPLPRFKFKLMRTPSWLKTLRTPVGGQTVVINNDAQTTTRSGIVTYYNPHHQQATPLPPGTPVALYSHTEVPGKYICRYISPESPGNPNAPECRLEFATYLDWMCHLITWHVRHEHDAVSVHRLTAKWAVALKHPDSAVQRIKCCAKKCRWQSNVGDTLEEVWKKHVAKHEKKHYNAEKELDAELQANLAQLNAWFLKYEHYLKDCLARSFV